MEYYKDRIKKLKIKILLCIDEEQRKYLKRLLKEFKHIVKDKTGRS